MDNPEPPNTSENRAKDPGNLDFSAKIFNFTAAIIEAVNEGKSVTTKNKKAILEAAEGIRKVLLTETPIAPASLTTPGIELQTLKQEILAGVNDQINKLTTELTKQKASYAAVVQATPPPKPQPQKPAIIITPTDSSEVDQTINTWKKQITFKDRKFAPSKVKPVSKGRILVEFDNDLQCREIISAVNNTKELQAEGVKRRPPLVILKGISKRIEKAELIKIISYQNTIPSEALRLCFLTSNRNEALYNAVLEVRPEQYAHFLALERVAVDHQRVHTEAFSRFVQCRKCLQFGHTGNKCTATVHPCVLCASEDHQPDTCPNKHNPEKYSCFNCIKYGNSNKTETNSDTKHPANSIKLCPRLQSAKKWIEDSTDYGLY